MDMFKWAAVLLLVVGGGLAAYHYVWNAGFDQMYEAHYGDPPPRP